MGQWLSAESEPVEPDRRIDRYDTDEEAEMGRWVPVAAAIAVGVSVAAGCGGSSDSATETDATETSGGDSGTLTGTVGPGFDISMEQTEVAAGTYALTVDDMATDHNFHLTGPGGVDVMTEVAETGKKTFTLDLEAGTYTFVCDPHASSMKGTLTVN